MKSPVSRPEYALERITLKMTSSLELAEVLEAITQGLVEELSVLDAQLWLSPEDSPTSLSLAAHEGPERPAVAASRLAEVAVSGEHFCTNSVPTDGSAGSPAWLLGHGLRSVAALPLEFRGSRLGVLAVYSQRAFSDREFERLFLFAREAAVAIQNARLFAEVDRLKTRLQAENRYLREQVDLEQGCGEIVGTSEAIRGVLAQVDQVAATDSTVLIQGETGTGKELIARAIHERSRRRGRPMVKVNCGAISPGLAESELFGHEKGAFTGALERRVGRFELADGGTLFLDEIAELPLATQVKLLRALQEQEFERLGSSQPIRVDVRIIAAGNRDLEAEITAGRFRADLFYRLNVFPIFVPPLRERRQDIGLIAGCSLARIGERLGRPLDGLSARALRHLESADWPGNVRELLNFVERAAIRSAGRLVDLPEEIVPSALLPSADDGEDLRSLKEVERAHIESVLRHTEGVIEGPSGAAVILEVHPNTLRSRMDRLGIPRPSRISKKPAGP